MKKLFLVLLVLSVFTVNAQVPSNVPTNGLVAYYPFNGNANDASGNGNNGTVNGATLTSDRFGNVNSAYGLTTLNDNLTITGTQPNFNNLAITVSLWVKFPSQWNQSSLALLKNGAPYTNGFDLAIDQNNSAYGVNNYLVVFLVGNGNAVTFITNQSELGQWSNIVGTYDGTNLKIYLNGILKATQPFNQSMNVPNNNLIFGSWDNPTTPIVKSRQLDDIAIYNRALSQQEITQLYTGQVIPSNVPTNGLVGYWPFNGNANDASGNGNNGTLQGSMILSSDRNGFSNSSILGNGTSSVVLNSLNLFPLGSNSRSISLFFKLNNTTITDYKELFVYGTNVTGQRFGINLYSNNRIGMEYYNQTTFANWVPDLNWHNIIVTYDQNSNVLKFYLDNNILINSAPPITLNTTSCCSYIGSLYGPNGNPNGLNPFQYSLDGKLDDIAIYNRALTQSEITQLYNSNSCIANITTNDTTICRGSSVTLNATAVNSASVTDINGNVYPSVNIGTQTWMQKNLNVSKYKNGDIIPQVTNATQWVALTTGAWCWYNNDSATYAATYGKLYNWYAVNDPRGLAPEGWHVPSNSEWNKLVKKIDQNADTICSGCAQSLNGAIDLKEAGGAHWRENTAATNSSNLTILPSGNRYYNGTFDGVVNYTLLWSSSEYNANSVLIRSLQYSNNQIYFGAESKAFGFPVRCLKNTPITYLWSTGATTPSINVSPTVTTKYYCTVSDGVNTCKDSVTVTVSTITTNLITADTIKVCGTSTTIFATTGLSSYAWSNGANTASTNVTSSGWYKCTASNGACTVVDSVYVSLFNPKITQNDTTVCAGTPLTLTVNNNTALTSSLPANLRNGLVGYWPFNGNANDESGNGYNGTVSGAILTADRFGNTGKAYSFNNNQYITINNSSALNSFPLTISLWYKANQWVSGENSHILTKYVGGSWNGFGISFNDYNNIPCAASFYLRSTTNRILGYYGEPSFDQTNVALQQWYHYVFVVDSVGGKIYINGNLASTHLWTGIAGPPNSDFPIKIGGADGNWFKGNIDDIAIYNKALSQQDIQNLYVNNTYLWSTGATTPSINVNPTATTSYIATVSNGINTCKDTVKVTVAPITTNLITADTIKVCGTSTTISATTGLANYAWSNGANAASTIVTSSGWYKCTSSNGACTAKDSVYVSLFNPKITQNDTTVCAGTPLTLTVNNNTALTSALPANLRNGLVGYWPFNGNANDESGNGNNGTVNGATLTSDRFGNVGKAYGFNNNYILIPSSNLYNSNNLSVSMWVSSSYLQKQVALVRSTYLNASNEHIGVSFNAFNQYDVVFGAKYNNPNCTPGIRWEYSQKIQNIMDANFHHIVGTIFGNTMYLYIDGLLAQAFTTPYSQTSSCWNGDIQVGRNWSNFTDYFNGKIDDIAIYNRTISATEVQQLFSGSSYLWSTTATTQSINVIPTATTSFIATVSNGINTCKDTVKITVANITSLSPANIFGAVDVCAAIGVDTASIPVNYKINKVANATSYVWTVPTGATLLSGQGDTSILVRFRSSFVSGAITVKSVSTCNVSSAVKSVTVYKRVAAAPTAIQNQFTPTSIAAVTNVTGSVSQIYRIKKVLYATSYNWYLNRGTNASITHINASGVNDTAVIVTFASCFVKDTLSVKSVTPCSISTAKTVIMSSSTTPATVAGIGTAGGDFAVCIGSSKTFTAIASTPTTTQVGIASYRWTKPVNTTITSATSDSSSITVSFNPGFTGGSLTAKGVSSCGVVGTVATSAILQYLPPTPLSIGSSTNSYNACINSSVTYTAIVGTATTAQAPATSFRWTRPNNTSITSASADSSSITVRFNTGYTGGAITVKSQSRCGTLSAARSQALTHTGCAIGTKLSQPITTTNNNSFEVSLYPNPTANAFKLLIKNSKTSGLSSSQAIVKVIDIQGRMMKSFQANTNQVIAIGNELKAGVYMVEVRLGEEVKTIRAVKF